MLFVSSGTDIEKAFGVKLITSPEMNNALKLWDSVSSGNPPWLCSEDEIGTVNMAKHICDTRAKLAMLDIGIAISGSQRADYLQNIADDLLKRLPDRVAEAYRLGGMVIKWNGDTWDYILPGNFGITDKDNNGNITGAIFASYAEQNGNYYTRLEYHRFDNGVYKITNKAFKNRLVSGHNAAALGSEVPLKEILRWEQMSPETAITNLEAPLFAYFRIPGANTIDPHSPLGLSVFANALTELRAVDVAISRKNAEVEDSKHITFVGQSLVQNAQNRNVTLPRFVKGLGMGLSDTETSAVHEHVPTMLTDQRIKDINFDLSLAGVKCGFSEGVFVMDGQSGMITATQVEADDRDTIQTVKTDRDALKDAIKQAIYGANALITLYGLAPLGDYDINFNFGDITYSYEEDKASWRYYAMQGWVPKWLYLVKFEGFSEEQAKAIVSEAAEAQLEKASLFGAE